jgi:hypothetical protein
MLDDSMKCMTTTHVSCRDTLDDLPPFCVEFLHPESWIDHAQLSLHVPIRLGRFLDLPVLLLHSILLLMIVEMRMNNAELRCGIGMVRSTRAIVKSIWDK